MLWMICNDLSVLGYWDKITLWGVVFKTQSPETEHLIRYKKFAQKLRNLTIKVQKKYMSHFLKKSMKLWKSIKVVTLEALIWLYVLKLRHHKVQKFKISHTMIAFQKMVKCEEAELWAFETPWKSVGLHVFVFLFFNMFLLYIQQ